ncbi:hypothetical protein OUZ56_004699 [Daphnia magna]|uniref:Uncharacterized protein n=1 Tax=Daphnia magna TaxID=35525 RepID=A0ABQ9YQX6_9CRUS|nr:hypothetical protein OUZ56_004699 [Daphnia magna]
MGLLEEARAGQVDKWKRDGCPKRPQRSQRYHVESGKKREWQHLETTAVAIDASASVLASNNGRQSYHYGDLKFRTGRMEAILCGIYSSFATSFEVSFCLICHLATSYSVTEERILNTIHPQHDDNVISRFFKWECLARLKGTVTTCSDVSSYEERSRPQTGKLLPHLSMNCFQIFVGFHQQIGNLKAWNFRCKAWKKNQNWARDKGRRLFRTSTTDDSTARKAATHANSINQFVRRASKRCFCMCCIIGIFMWEILFALLLNTGGRNSHQLARECGHLLLSIFKAVGPPPTSSSSSN